ncbi:MAG TPA: phosphoribosylanthranilate isomerase [Xanthomonadales bacterium]|nr:phosphoribosylanthranilate isomerase [Xanthomonadales bacterium]
MRTRIKFCGFTRPGDVRLAGELGVDAVGLIFAPRSQRRLELSTALAVRAAAPPMLSVVALFMDNTAAEVERVVATLQPHLLQFHGQESESFCSRWGLPWLKAVAMETPNAEQAALEWIKAYPRAAGFVLDGHAPGGSGGAGRRFDWSKVPPVHKPWLLAGGLHPGNVGAAIAKLQPWGVDVSSGIERAPGIKDGAIMEQFVIEVRRADGARGN